MRKQGTHVGDVRTEIAGGQYHGVELAPGTALTLEREPQNPHDPNAIRVSAASGRPAGYIPRTIAAWLAPLMDEEKLRLKASAGQYLDEKDAFSLDLKVYAETKGAYIFEPLSAPPDEATAVREVIRQAFKKVADYDNPEVVEALGRKLAALAQEDRSPETQLLLHLFPSRAGLARKAQARRVTDRVRKCLAELEIAPGLHHHNLTVFPLLSTNGHEPGYLLLQEAIASRLAEVTEVCESGSVPTLRVSNRAPKPILILEGEILVGAKQNRVVNITVIIAAMSEFKLPVSCVEQGRWHAVSRHFESRYYAPPKLRADKLSSVQASRRSGGASHSDQGQVWANVSGILSGTAAASPSDSLTDAYEQGGDRLGGYREKIRLPEGTMGFVVAGDGKVIGMDLFDCPATLEKLSARLLDAYFIEASCGEKETAPTASEVVGDFLARIPSKLRQAERKSGSGVELEIDGGDIVGTAVVLGDRVCHLSAFTVERQREPGRRRRGRHGHDNIVY
jgi:hypothetical protein